MLFLIGNFISINYKHYVPAWHGLGQRVIRQVRFYLQGIMRGEHHPFPATEKSKFNPLQQLAYIVVMFVMMPIILITGILLQLPELAPDRILGAGGIWPVAVTHAVVAFWGTLFALVHMYLGSTGRATTPLYSAMITGWHEDYHPEDEEDEHRGSAPEPGGDDSAAQGPAGGSGSQGPAAEPGPEKARDSAADEERTRDPGGTS